MWYLLCTNCRMIQYFCIMFKQTRLRNSATVLMQDADNQYNSVFLMFSTSTSKYSSKYVSVILASIMSKCIFLNVNFVLKFIEIVSVFKQHHVICGKQDHIYVLSSCLILYVNNSLLVLYQFCNLWRNEYCYIYSSVPMYYVYVYSNLTDKKTKIGSCSLQQSDCTLYTYSFFKQKKS